MSEPRLEVNDPLGRRLGENKIAKPFHRSEVELAIFERAPRELAGLCQSTTFDRGERFQHAGDHRLTAM